MSNAASNLPGRIGELLARLRERRPVVHQMTNAVTMGDLANATLALGALPVMAVAAEEVEQIVGAAQSLVLNLGTPTRERVDAMMKAGRAANASGIPVVLDPVGVGASAFRQAITRRLLGDVRVAILRANPAEASSLLGARATMRGVESEGDYPSEELAARLARAHTTVAAVTGARDHVSDGRRLVVVSNGDPLLARISGGGDLATLAAAAFAAVEPDALVAASAGLAALGVAAELAAALTRARGPGSFKVALLDSLASLTPEDLIGRARCAAPDAAWT